MSETSTIPTTDTVNALTDPDELRALRTAVNARLAALLDDAHGQAIVPGRRVRVAINITPICVAHLTGTTQPSATGHEKNGRIDVLLDESSTEAMRRDHRVHATRRVTAPDQNTTRHLLTQLPTGSLMLADHDN
ncbi:hypothetical protein ACFVYG_32445 [Streptomyces sp. NPDC058256]|uniref:hypothetical protein n=1 Tax=Streptomyces sp. NPDC058256 TaxID=3346408 RepID=UPI0036F16325